MDAAALTRLIIILLTPLTSKLDITSIHEKSDEAVQQGKRLYELLQARFARERDGGKASKALQSFIEDPDYSATVERKLYPLLQADPDFAETLRSTVQTGPRYLLTPEEETEASRIRQANTLGIVRQEISAGQYSTIERNRMNISETRVKKYSTVEDVQMNIS